MNSKERRNLTNKKTFEDGSTRYTERRDIENFKQAIKAIKEQAQMSYQEFACYLGLGKNVVGNWFWYNAMPSQRVQHELSERLHIDYEKFLFEIREGKYPCGLRICTRCNTEFLVYKHLNHQNVKCAACIQQVA